MAKTPQEIYEDEEWAERRQLESKWGDWYSGKRIMDAESRSTDPETGEPIKLYPLAINPIAKVCRIHRSVLLGMISDYDDMPVKTLFMSYDKTESARKSIEDAQRLITEIWEDSGGPSIVQEAALMMQISGGHAFKIAWEPWNVNLRHRIRVVSLRSHLIHPIYDVTDMWHLKECYIGYPITPDEALDRYGIKTRSATDVLYLEHWTEDTYEITVDGKVPTINGVELRGANELGHVPVVYVPHLRSGDFFGVSHVPDLIGMTREKNSRSADRGDAVRETTHPQLYIKNVTSTPKVTTIIDQTGRPIASPINLGSAKSIANAPEPEMGYASAPAIPEAVLAYDNELWAEIRRQGDVASVAMGDDDVSGGRITGPVTAYRMWPTMSHTQIERVDFSMAIRMLARLMLIMHAEKSVSYVELGVKSIKLSSDVLDFTVTTAWAPQIPIEVEAKVNMLTTRLKSGGISLYTYLKELGVRDADEEAERIWADKERQAEIDAIAQTKVAEVKAESDMAMSEMQVEASQEAAKLQAETAKVTAKANAEAKAKQPVAASNFGGR